LTIDKKLENYLPGRPNMKPDVINQMVIAEKKKRETIENNKLKININLDGNTLKLSVFEINQLINKLKCDNEMLIKELNLVKTNYNRLINKISNNN
jgi:hypothetical protein